jgi:hypothetical protein
MSSTYDALGKERQIARAMEAIELSYPVPTPIFRNKSTFNLKLRVVECSPVDEWDNWHSVETFCSKLRDAERDRPYDGCLSVSRFVAHLLRCAHIAAKNTLWEGDVRPGIFESFITDDGEDVQFKEDGSEIYVCIVNPALRSTHDIAVAWKQNNNGMTYICFWQLEIAEHI